jgi:hypothetical protein
VCGPPVAVLSCCTVPETTGADIRFYAFKLGWSYGYSNSGPLACHATLTGVWASPDEAGLTDYLRESGWKSLDDVGVPARRLLCLGTTLYPLQGNGPRAPLASVQVL